MGFVKSLREKQEALWLLKRIFSILIFGLFILAFLMDNEFFIIQSVLCVFIVVILEIVDFRVEKCLKEPNKLVVYDSYVTKLEHSVKYTSSSLPDASFEGRERERYLIYVKTNTTGSFAVLVTNEIYKKYNKNDRILAVYVPLIGGILVTEEDCNRFNFQRIVVHNVEN